MAHNQDSFASFFSYGLNYVIAEVQQHPANVLGNHIYFYNRFIYISFQGSIEILNRVMDEIL